MAKPKCKFGIDTCDGINGNSGFICNDCVEDAEFEAEIVAGKIRNDQGRPWSEIIEEDLTARKPVVEEPHGE